MAHSISLRDVVESDLPTFFEQQLDLDAAKMAAFPSRDKDAFMEHWAKIRADDKITIKAIIFDEEIAGNIACFEMDEEWEVGYWIGKEFWGKGIASESLKQFLGQVMKRPLYAHVAKHNIASQRVLQKRGFEVIGEGKWTPSSQIGEIEEFILELK